MSIRALLLSITASLARARASCQTHNYIFTTALRHVTSAAFLIPYLPTWKRETAGSRVLLLDGEAHDVAKLGSGWITDNETGLAFSNDTYQPRQYPAWYDCLHFDDMPAALPCPSCGSNDAELISAYHGLYECPHCACLFDDYGDVWTDGNGEGGL